jgi:hypothetical protein
MARERRNQRGSVYLLGILLEFICQSQVLVRLDAPSNMLLHRLIVVVANLLEIQMFGLLIDKVVFEMLQFGLQKSELILVRLRQLRLDELMEETELAGTVETS